LECVLAVPHIAQDHRASNEAVSMTRLKSFASAAVTLAYIELTSNSQEPGHARSRARSSTPPHCKELATEDGAPSNQLRDGPRVVYRFLFKCSQHNIYDTGARIIVGYMFAGTTDARRRASRWPCGRDVLNPSLARRTVQAPAFMRFPAVVFTDAINKPATVTNIQVVLGQQNSAFVQRHCHYTFIVSARKSLCNR